MTDPDRPAEDDGPTDLDLVTDHPFRSLATGAAFFPDTCGHLVDGWLCGYSRAEHAP